MRLFSQDTKVEALGRCPLFEGLSKKELKQLATLTEDVEVLAGNTLTREGQLGSEFFVIVEGEVEIVRGGKTVATLGPGDFFGEIALLVEKTPRTATASAKSPARLFVLTRGAFKGLLDESHAVERKVLRALGERLRDLSDDPTL